MHYVIFSIDKVSDLRTKAKFLRYIDTQRVMNYMKGTMVLCIGCYKGVLEDSFIIRSDDFDTFVRNSGYVDNQESVLHVRGKRMHCEFEYLKGGCDGGGRLIEVTPRTAFNSDGWTYRPDMNTYWIIKEC
jgi:hypothetical protein